jgi:hypothetical protein
MTDVPTLYRYTDEPDGYGSFHLYLYSFSVLGETKCGYWFYDGHFQHRKRFVLKNSRKRFAHSTTTAALQSFKRRKQSQITILNRQLDRARIALSLADDSYTSTLTPITCHGVAALC